jgi:hypothetical protein
MARAAPPYLFYATSRSDRVIQRSLQSIEDKPQSIEKVAFPGPISSN